MSDGIARLCLALDVPGVPEARRLVGQTADSVQIFKIGLEMFCAAGPSFVKEVVQSGSDVFLDLKLCDIPNTVARAIVALGRLGVSIATIHTTGGSAMMRAAAEAAAGLESRPSLLGVTLLTSLDQRAVSRDLRMRGSVSDNVKSLACMAQESGLDGVVCSPHEISVVREVCGPGFLIVAPGIRPTWASGSDDQRRVLCPAEAVQRGADVIVVGRPISQADDPSAASRRIRDEISC